MKTITIANQKGGVGKTTTSQAMLEGFKRKGFKVLGIDTDPQSNLSSLFHYQDNGKTIFNVLQKEPILDCIIHTEEGIDLIQGDFRISTVDQSFTQINKHYLLKEAIDPIKKNYDFIIIDTAPTMNTMTMNAFTCSDSVLIPMFADLFSIQGLAQLFNTIQAIQVYINKDLKIDGMLINQFQVNTKVNQNLSNELAKISQEQQIPIYQTKIRQGTAIRQQQVEQESIFDSSSNVARDFEIFIEEYLRKEKQKQSESIEKIETLDSE